MERKRIFARMALVATAAMITWSCGRTTPAPDAASPAASAPPSAAAEWVTKGVAFADGYQKNREAVLRDIGKLELKFQRRLLTFSGIEAELGGPEAADAALRALMSEVYSQATQTDYAWMRVADDMEPSGAAAVAMSSFEFLLVSFGFNDLVKQGPGTRNNESGPNRMEMEVTGDSVNYASASEHEAGGMKVKMQNKLKVNVCPDASGKIDLELSSTSSMSRGTKGANTKIEVHVTRYVDDDAKMEGLELEQRVEAAAFGGTEGTFVDLGVGLSTRSDDASYERVNRQSSRATDADVADAKALAAIMKLMALSITEQTRDVWEKGGCVKLDTPSTPAKRSGVKPGTSFSVLAQPRSKVDGSSVGGTVRGDLTGEASLDPAASKVRADASFTYVAPGERNKEGKLKFEARSKRGIATADVAFNTNGDSYRVEGGADEFHGAGVACDLGEQFFIEGSGVTVRFEPESAAGGRYSYSGNMSGFAVYGHGVYSVKYQDEVAVGISAHGPGSVKTPMGVQTAEGSEEYTLTPVSDAGCGVT